jgi:hypothetical protein
MLCAGRTWSSRFRAPRRSGRRSSRSSQTSSSARSPHSPSTRSTAVSRQPSSGSRRQPLGLANGAVVLGCGERVDRAPGVLVLRPRRLHGQGEPSLPLVEPIVLD